MTGTLVFDPLLPWPVLYVVLGLAALGIAATSAWTAANAAAV